MLCGYFCVCHEDFSYIWWLQKIKYYVTYFFYIYKRVCVCVLIGIFLIMKTFSFIFLIQNELEKQFFIFCKIFEQW